MDSGFGTRSGIGFADSLGVAGEAFLVGRFPIQYIGLYPPISGK